MSAPVYLALLHYPMTNRLGELVTTAVTNIDIHDIARSSRTYGLKGYFLVTPLDIQHEMVGRILKHWQSDQSRQWHPDRFEALSRVQVAKDFKAVKDAVKAELARERGVDVSEIEDPEVVLTDARPLPNAISYADYRLELERPDRTRPTIIVFGTGWGISDIFYPEVHRILTPVYGPKDEKGEDYNHLSVRAAVAIILDRLLGR